MFVDFGRAGAPSAANTVCLRQVYRLEADETYQVHHEPLPSGDKILILVTRGSGFFQCGSFSASFSPGDSLLISPGTQTFQYYTLGDSWDFWWFEFSGEEPSWEGKRKLQWDSLTSLLCGACLEALKKGESREASALFGGLLARIHLRCGWEQKGGYREERYFQAQQMIRQELGAATVGGIAERIGVSPRTLRDLFQEFAGCSPKQYILQTKLDTACYLLENTSKSIGEIGEDLGFSSQFHFSRTFRESKGIPPGVWRTRKPK